MTTKLRPSHKAQSVDEDTWYYETRGKIEVVAWRECQGRRYPFHINIPRNMLNASLQRMNADPKAP